MAKQSWRLALREYLVTPLDSNTQSPSELNGHRFNSLLPYVSTFSRHSDVLVVIMMLNLNMTREAMYCQSCLLAPRLDTEIMSPISLMLVLFQLEMPGRIQIYTENGVYVSQNRIDLKWTDAPFEPKTQPFICSNAKSKHAPPITPVPSGTNVKHNSKAKLTEKRVEVRKSN